MKHTLIEACLIGQTLNNNLYLKYRQFVIERRCYWLIGQGEIWRASLEWFVPPRYSGSVHCIIGPVIDNPVFIKRGYQPLFLTSEMLIDPIQALSQ